MQDVVLAEPVRQRLLQVAAQVLGRLPADEVPASLRAVARFTPAKRARLGSIALAAALDADPDFRDRVAEVAAEASPQLVALLRDGASTAASDPVDTAVLAYLVRPDGWADALAEAAARWSDERATRDAGAEEQGRLRAEIAELRAHAKGEATRTREAAKSASADVMAENEQLRRALRARTGELRTAERDRDEASARIEGAELELLEATAAHGDEVRRLRSRIADLERSVEAMRRDTRTSRDVDEARLRLLLETMTEAAAGVRRELSLPAGSLRPADAIVIARAADPTHTVAGVAALGRLLELPRVHVIVDGYNVTKTGYPELPLVDQRNRLIGSLAALQARSGVELTIAFDGSTRPPSMPRAPRGVRVLFSAGDEPADDLIRRLVAAEPSGRPVVVVTTDAQIVSDVLRAGAWTAPSAVLLARLG
ncbi:MAG: NYN domain-containing protein [Actinomycetota bacterium]|nr:NYN domain-containing protein [Actinomycetota bacterium]